MTLSLGRPETSTHMITTNLAAQWNRLRLCTKAWRVRKDNCELFILCSLCKVYRVWALASLSARASLGTRGRRRGRAWVVRRVRDNRKNIKYTAAWPCVLCVVIIARKVLIWHNVSCLVTSYQMSQALQWSKISTCKRWGKSELIYYLLDNVCGLTSGQANKNSTWLMGIVSGREPILAILAIHRSNIWLRISGYCLLPGITQIRPLTHINHSPSLPDAVCAVLYVLCKVL